MSDTLPKDSKLLKSRDFDGLRTGSVYLSTKNIYAFFKPNSLKLGRVGITASRKTGGAVYRNTFKRAVREAFRKSEIKSKSLDLLVIARPGLQKKNIGKDKLFTEIQYLLSKLEGKLS